MCVQDHEQYVEVEPLAQVVTIGATELEALRQQAARVPALEAQAARVPALAAQAARVPQLEEQVTRLENDRRVRLADIERIATKLRARRASFINCAAEFASMKHLYSMR